MMIETLRKRIAEPSEAQWLIPATVLAGIGALVVLLAVPDISQITVIYRTGIVLALASLPIGFILLFLHLLFTGERHPAARIRSILWERPRMIALALIQVFLLSSVITIFQALKQLLNRAVSFRIDTALAQLDRSIFFGEDPSRVLASFDIPAAEIFYHEVWGAALYLCILLLIAQPASADKSALMLGYVGLWLVIGPLVHCLAPAAGPVFYQRLGFGDHFADARWGTGTVRIADYLWGLYAAGRFGPGGGISGMPSLHVATAVWVAMAAWIFAPRWRLAAVMFAAVIFVLSIALGWHYFTDGLVGTVLTVATVNILRGFFSMLGAMPIRGVGERSLI